MSFFSGIKEKIGIGENRREKREKSGRVEFSGRSKVTNLEIVRRKTPSEYRIDILTLHFTVSINKNKAKKGREKKKVKPEKIDVNFLAGEEKDFAFFIEKEKEENRIVYIEVTRLGIDEEDRGIALLSAKKIESALIKRGIKAVIVEPVLDEGNTVYSVTFFFYQRHH